MPLPLVLFMYLSLHASASCIIIFSLFFYYHYYYFLHPLFLLGELGSKVADLLAELVSALINVRLCVKQEGTDETAIQNLGTL